MRSLNKGVCLNVITAWCKRCIFPCTHKGAELTLSFLVILISKFKVLLKEEMCREGTQVALYRRLLCFRS